MKYIAVLVAALALALGLSLTVLADNKPTTSQRISKLESQQKKLVLEIKSLTASQIQLEEHFQAAVEAEDKLAARIDKLEQVVYHEGN